MSELLSQNEIDALLHGAKDGMFEADEVDDRGSYELYDLSSGIHRTQGWSHDIKIVDERIQSNLSISLLGLLHKSVNVRRKDIQILKFGDYVKQLVVPTSVTTFTLKGYTGYSAIVMDAQLVYALVNIFFGGGSRQVDIEGKEFSATEQRVIQLVLKTIVEAFRTGWKALSEIEFIQTESEVNPSAITSYSDNDVLMIRPFSVEFDGGGGEVQIWMPGSTIDAIFKNKNSVETYEGTTREELLKSRSLNFKSIVSGEIKGASLNISELFSLVKGDIIPVDSPEKIDVKVNGVTKFQARMGELKGKVGLKIIS